MTQTFSQLIGECEPSEYADNRAVFLIDDGERHWYVATNAAKALAEHISLMDCDDTSDFNVAWQTPETLVTVHYDHEDDARRDVPEGAEVFRIPDDAHGNAPFPWRVRATAGQWARHYAEARQIASSVF